MILHLIISCGRFAKGMEGDNIAPSLLPLGLHAMGVFLYVSRE